MNIKTKFDLKEVIYIPAIERPGVVVSINVGIDKGITYSVSWFNNGEYYSAFLFPFELEKKKK